MMSASDRRMVAPEKTATNPIPAKAQGQWHKMDKALP
jgi:hypothetical protein